MIKDALVASSSPVSITDCLNDPVITVKSPGLPLLHEIWIKIISR